MLLEAEWCMCSREVRNKLRAIEILTKRGEPFTAPEAALIGEKDALVDMRLFL